MSDASPLPRSILKAGGRTVPFDGDRISRALFAATERMGRPDPFLARELTDGVLHFLAAEATDPIPVGDVTDAIIKVVRELGHPVLARAFQESGVRSKESRVRDQKSGLLASDPRPLTPDLQAAEREGLLRFFDANSAKSLAGTVLPPGEGSWIDGIVAPRDWAGQYVAIDGPEFLLTTPAAATEWAREVRSAITSSGLVAVVNLNTIEPPGWAMVAGGPLFVMPPSEDGEHRRDVAAAIAEELLETSTTNIRIDWHLGERDFRPTSGDRLIRLAKFVADDAPITFITDQPRRPVSLAEGLDRDHPAVLAAIGVGLARLLKIVGAGNTPAGLLTRIGSLARLALSAGHVRRGVLRHHGSPSEPLSRVLPAGFLLDRARLLVVPLGLGEVVRSVTSLHQTERGLALARDILLGLNAALLRDAARVPAVIGAAPPFSAPTESPDDAAGTPQQQLRAAAALHTAIGSGTAVIRLPPGLPPQPEEFAELLSFAWQQPGLDRFSFRASGDR